MTTHYDDEAQIELLRSWWRENWIALISGLSLGLAAIFGWQAWTRHQDRQATLASQLFEDLRKAADAGKTADAAGMADALQKDYADTPYAADGALTLARALVEAGKFDDARTRLQWTVDHAKESGIRALARLRLATVLWQQDKADEALAQLDKPDPAFAALYSELRGDILLDKGDRGGARAAYAQALAILAEDSPGRDGLQRKLDDLADAATVKS